MEDGPTVTPAICTVPGDVREVFVHTVAHRLLLSPRAESRGKQADQILREILESVDAPKLR